MEVFTEGSGVPVGARFPPRLNTRIPAHGLQCMFDAVPGFRVELVLAVLSMHSLDDPKHPTEMTGELIRVVGVQGTQVSHALFPNPREIRAGRHFTEQDMPLCHAERTRSVTHRRESFPVHCSLPHAPVLGRAYPCRL